MGINKGLDGDQPIKAYPSILLLSLSLCLVLVYSILLW